MKWKKNVFNVDQNQLISRLRKISVRNRISNFKLVFKSMGPIECVCIPTDVVTPVRGVLSLTLLYCIYVVCKCLCVSLKLQCGWTDFHNFVSVNLNLIIILFCYR